MIYDDLFKKSMSISGTDFIGGTDSIFLRPIFQAYVRGYPQKIWPDIWYSTSILKKPEIPVD